MVNSNQNNELVLFSVGSNFGDRQAHIEKAYDILISNGTLTDAMISSYYETEPYGITEQAWFLNVGIIGTTTLSEFELLKNCQNIESIIGRKKRRRWHEREIDIDIISYGQRIIEDSTLQIPHPRLHKRKFVLVPLNEIAGNVFIPKYKMSIKQLLDDCQDSSEVRLFS